MAWKAAKDLPAWSRMRELFDYHEDGFLIRRLRTGPTTFVGQEVRGTVRKSDGYLVVRIDGVQYLFHRVIYAWHYNPVPDMLDHDDRDKANCRIGNLKPTTPLDSAHNTWWYGRGTSRRSIRRYELGLAR